MNEVKPLNLILIVARCQREAEDYRRTLTKEQAKRSLYACYPEHFRGIRNDETEVHLIGYYFENPMWGYIRDDINTRGLTTKEVEDWR